MAGDHNPAARRHRPADDLVIVDVDGQLADRAVQFRAWLGTLHEERMCAREIGLDRDDAFMADLECELAETRCAYAAAAILWLAGLRAALGGRNQG